MKKILLTFLSLSISSLVYSQEQIVLSENFESLPLGNIGTDFTGTTAGAGGWFIYGGAGTLATDFQVVNITTAQGKSAQITSGSGYASTSNPNNRYLFKDISSVVATPSNNILLTSAKIYTGPATGAGRMQAVFYDATSGVVGMYYDLATKTIKGYGKLTPTSTGTPAFYSINLGTQVFPANTWVTVEFSYNSTTGAYTWAYTDGTAANTGSYGISTAPTGYSLVPGLVASEFDLVNLTLTGNTVANVAGADDILVKFTNATLLNVNDVNPAQVGAPEVIIYPNPTSDFIYIKTNSKILNVTLFDMNGRSIKANSVDNAVDVRNLQSGTYLINIETAEGSNSQKFIKK